MEKIYIGWDYFIDHIYSAAITYWNTHYNTLARINKMRILYHCSVKLHTVSFMLKLLCLCFGKNSKHLYSSIYC